MNLIRNLKWALPLTLVLVLATTIVASAITIVVDGDREAAWDGVGGQTPGLVTDGLDPGINGNVNISTFQWTNDGTNFFFLVGVHAPPPLMSDLAPIDICLDTDSSAATDIPVTNTSQRNRCSYSTGVTGIDTVVEGVRDTSSGNEGVIVWDVTVDPAVVTATYANDVTNTYLGYNPGSTTPVVEITVPLSDLGYGPGNCPAAIPAVVFFDGGDTNPDDNLPDTGSTPIRCGTPTAIRLSNMRAQNNNSSVIALAAAMLLLMGGALLVYKRSQV